MEYTEGSIRMLIKNGWINTGIIIIDIIISIIDNFISQCIFGTYIPLYIAQIH